MSRPARSQEIEHGSHDEIDAGSRRQLRRAQAADDPLLGGSTGLSAGLGDVITAAVKEASPDGTAKKGTVVKAVIVRTRKEHRRRDGTYIRFDQNAAVLINDAH